MNGCTSADAAWRSSQAAHRENERRMMCHWDSVTTAHYIHKQQLLAIRADGERALNLAAAYEAIPQWGAQKVTRFQADVDLWLITRQEEERWRVLGESMDLYGIQRIGLIDDVCMADASLSGSVAFRQAAELRYVAAANAAGEWLAARGVWLGPTPAPAQVAQATPPLVQASLWEMGELSA
ncbi:MAG TPA: hypothetical protein VMV29_08830 [Ktedonobacterales bacterium]|nr:hypothetical protein [Ktedonobacterales bacterium]